MNILRMFTIALEAFGYTEAEANFLYLVATRSGYFTCQQFVRFTGGKSGKRTISFVRKLPPLESRQSGGIVDYFCLRKKAEGNEMHQLSTSDLAELNAAKAKFNYREIDVLYQLGTECRKSSGTAVV